MEVAAPPTTTTTTTTTTDSKTTQSSSTVVPPLAPPPGINAQTEGLTHSQTHALPQILNIDTNAAPKSAAQTDASPYTLDGVPSFNPVQALSVTALFLGAFAFIGMSIVRMRRGKSGGNSRPEKPMEVVSALPIGPKRQIMIIRIRDQEIVIASTENGVTMLTDVAEKRHRPMVADTRPLQLLTKQAPESKQNLRIESDDTAPSLNDSNNNKSEFLMKALNNLKEKKSIKQEPTTSNLPTESETQREASKARTPALSNNKGGFNKFFASAFEQEAKRAVSKSQASKNGIDSEESVENVTKMIREKLKNMQPTGN
jgi:flagellar biogenesis protein FliO